MAAVRRQGGCDDFPQILREGPLLHVVQHLMAVERRTLDTIRVSLPDRVQGPFSFEGGDLMNLIKLSTAISL